jgi:REP element-mobilizing transposase RayT
VPVNRLHHVTNRGVDRSALFDSPVDRFVFLSILAACCLDDGLRVHAFCLMTNHFHVLVEDPRGLLSHMMLRLQTAYARYRRDTSGRRGSGHVFGDRFFSRTVASARDYRAVVDYILRNPLECNEPLAVSAEAYLWSSASIHVGEKPSALGCAALVERFGGIEALLHSLPRPASARLERARRHRIECFVRGDWLDADSARCGRTGQAMAVQLTNRVRLAREEQDRDTDDATIEDLPAPSVLPMFRGHERQTVREALKGIAEFSGQIADLTAYALWRFARESCHELAKESGSTVEQLVAMVARIRVLRETNRAVHEALSRLEWRMTFALGGAPWRL